VKLTDLNRQRSIGANCLLIELGPFRILVDAGLNPKAVGKEATPDFSLLEDDTLDFILLTHSHLDHLGSLPLIMRKHPEATVITSVPTVSLAPRMLRNSCNVMKKQKAELNIPEYPLYEFGEIDDVERRLLPILFNQPKTFYAHDDALEITYFAAGHVAGAAAIKLVYKKERIFFTGDVLFDAQRILPGACLPDENFDIVVTETTRGQTERSKDQSRELETARLVETIDRTIRRGGSVLIPSFALGRMQEMFALIHAQQQARNLPFCDVFATGLGMDLVNYLDMITRKTDLVHFRIHTVKQLGVKPLKHALTPGIDVAQKGIYILSSGMLVPNTPAYHVAASLLDHSHNAICFVGYCDPDTPGGQLLATSKGNSFLFDKLDHVATVRAHIEKYDLSGHADRQELVDFALACNPRTIVLTHGDPPAREWFEDELQFQSPKTKIIDPLPGKTYSL